MNPYESPHCGECRIDPGLSAKQVALVLAVIFGGILVSLAIYPIVTVGIVAFGYWHGERRGLAWMVPAVLLANAAWLYWLLVMMPDLVFN